MNIREPIVRGLKKLYLLRLPGTPGADKIAEVGAVWIEVIANHHRWDDADRGRIDKAFARLIAAADRWPSPRALLDRLPPAMTPITPITPRKTDPKAAAEVQKMLDEAAQMLRPGYMREQKSAGPKKNEGRRLKPMVGRR